MTDTLNNFALKVVEWIGVPYEHRGTTQNGCDCTGLIIGAAKEVGLMQDYKLRKYPLDWNIHQIDNYIVDELKRYGYEISKSEIQAGDIIVMRFGMNLSHCGILIDKSKMTFIHCYRTLRKVSYGILRNSKWSKRWEKTFRLRISG